jgi:hypothetical protein
MVHDPDIYRVARLLIDRQGEGASQWAAERVDESLVGDDVTGITMWSAIGRAIDELRRDRQDDDALN